MLYLFTDSDLSEATLTGAWMSIIAALLIATLVALVNFSRVSLSNDNGQELTDYMTLKTKSEMVVLRDRPGDLLRINFNLRFFLSSDRL